MFFVLHSDPHALAGHWVGGKYKRWRTLASSPEANCLEERTYEFINNWNIRSVACTGCSRSETQQRGWSIRGGKGDLQLSNQWSIQQRDGVWTRLGRTGKMWTGGDGKDIGMKAEDTDFRYTKQNKQKHLKSNRFCQNGDTPAIIVTVLVPSGCYNKLPWIVWLKQQIFISHSSGSWKV